MYDCYLPDSKGKNTQKAQKGCLMFSETLESPNDPMLYHGFSSLLPKKNSFWSIPRQTSKRVTKPLPSMIKIADGFLKVFNSSRWDAAKSCEKKHGLYPLVN